MTRLTAPIQHRGNTSLLIESYIIPRFFKVQMQGYYRENHDFSKYVHRFFTKKLPDIPIIGEKHGWRELIRMNCREYGLRRSGVEISLYDSDAIRETRVSTRCIWVEGFLYFCDRSIRIKRHFDSVRSRENFLISRNHYSIHWAGSGADIRVTCDRSEAILHIGIPVGSCDRDDLRVVRLSLILIECTIGIEVIHRRIDTSENEESEDSRKPISTILSRMWVYKMFHTYLQKEQSNYNI